ncbi:hypothetical protein LCM28_09905 [Salipiger pacificus]|nr:hypothetical protein [Alloyangia pacifica]
MSDGERQQLRNQIHLEHVREAERLKITRDGASDGQKDWMDLATRISKQVERTMTLRMIDVVDAYSGSADRNLAATAKDIRASIEEARKDSAALLDEAKQYADQIAEGTAKTLAEALAELEEVDEKIKAAQQLSPDQLVKTAAAAQFLALCKSVEDYAGTLLHVRAKKLTGDKDDNEHLSRALRKALS